MTALTARTPSLKTKLPAVGTTIFTVMSAMATEHKAVNLGQGFPDFDCDPKLVAAVNQAMTAGLNQYPPMVGVPYYEKPSLQNSTLCTVSHTMQTVKSPSPLVQRKPSSQPYWQWFIQAMKLLF